MCANAAAQPAPQPQAHADTQRKPVAIFVCHGMGQQVHFETIEGVVNALLREEGRRAQRSAQQLHALIPEQKQSAPQAQPPGLIHRLAVRLAARPPRAPQTAQAELAMLGDRTVVRGRVPLGAGTDAGAREVHIYEGYWAPLTEGKITVSQVFGFLFSAARLGIWNCLRNGKFIRFMFNKKEVFKGLHLVGLASLAMLTYFALALLVGPVLLVNAITLTSVLSLLFRKAPAAWISSPLLNAGTWYVARIELFLFALGVAVVVLPKLYAWFRRKMLLLRIVSWMIRAACFALAFWSLAGLAVSTYSALAYLARYAMHSVTGAGPDALGLIQPLLVKPGPHFLHVWLSAALRWFAGWTHLPYTYLRLALAWALALVFGYLARWFLIEFAGDVAIYTSSYKVSDFDEVRDKIRSAVLDAARPVYLARSDQAEAGHASDASLLYDHVFVVGHSLGSVIAYDTLNSLLVEDSFRANPVNVAGRTRLLLTFGSPLDKTAFIFRTHSSSTHDFREKAAEQLQLLIRNYAYRPDRWINIWSPMDIISGHLKYYDDTDPIQGGAKRVDNCWDKEAWVPFAAHTEYWTNSLFAQVLYDAILAAP